MLRCFTCDGKGHTSKQCLSKTLFCGNQNKPSFGDKGTVVHCQGFVNGLLVNDLLLDIGCSKTIVWRDLVGEEQWLEEESTIIQCAHGDAIAYPLAEVQLQIQGKSVLVRAAVSDTLPQLALVGTDVPGMLEMLQGAADLEEDPIESALVVMTRSRTRGQLEEDINLVSGVEDNVQETSKKSTNPVSHEVVSTSINPEVEHVVSFFIDEFNFDDEFFLQDQECKPKLTRSQKHQVRHEHTERLQQSVGLDIPISQFQELQENDASLETFRKGGANGSCFKQNRLWYHKWTPKPYHGYSVNQLLLPKQRRQKVLQLAHSIPLSGHMGRDRTLQRIQQRFYCPSLFRDVDIYCRSCPECQKVSTPRKQRFPLISLPIMEEPFERIAIDIVDPLPRSRKGYQYVLVICDYAIRCPKAFTL